MVKKHRTAFMDETELRTKLISGLKELNLELDDRKLDQLVQYVGLLGKWNRIYNLTAIRDMEQMLTHHLLDSLTVIPWVSHCKHLLDVGSGGGLPGLIIAIVCPDMAVEMIDIVSKKTAFIRQVTIEMGLNNVKVHTGRVEELSTDSPFDGIISRAFSSIPDFVALTSHLLSEKGRYYAMKGLIPEYEISNLDRQWKTAEIVSLAVPQLDAQRHLVIIEKNPSISILE